MGTFGCASCGQSVDDCEPYVYGDATISDGRIAFYNVHGFVCAVCLQLAPLSPWTPDVQLDRADVVVCSRSKTSRYHEPGAVLGYWSQETMVEFLPNLAWMARPAGLG